MAKETRLEALHRALTEKAGQPVLFGDLVRAVWGDTPPSSPLPALRTLVRRLRQSVDDEIVTDASGYRLVVRLPGPSQLPADLPDFVGRREELAALSSSDERVLAITGPPGIGKTALAVRLAHRIRDRFPDGQLHVDLRGFATGPTVTTTQAVGRFLRALGVPPPEVPPGLDEQVELYRSKLRGRKVLVLLDNATGLSPLVPDVEGCAAIVTSRNELPGQTGLGVLTDGEADVLLDRMKIGGSPDDRAELVRLCAHLPLALRIAGAQLADRHLPDYLADLRGDDRLDALEIEGDAAVRAAFALSYQALPDDARRLFGLLSVHPGADFGPASAAVLGETSTEEGARLLGVLARAGLVQQSGERFALHDLIRLFASEQAGTDGPPALRRLLSFYLATASNAAGVVSPGLTRLDPIPLEVEGREFATADEAGAWLDGKRGTLVAAVQVAPHPFAHRLTDAMRGYLNYAGHRPELGVALESGLASARAAGDRPGQAAMHNGFGHLHWVLGAYPKALESYGEALELTESPVVRATLFNNLGLVRRDLGDLDGALADMEEARRTVPEESALHANVLMNLGTIHGARAELRQAVAHLTKALRRHEEAGAWVRAAVCHENIAVAHIELGEYDEARPHLESAMAGYERYGMADSNKPNLLANLADVADQAGEHDQARAFATEGLELARRFGDVRVEVEALIRLGEAREAAELADRIDYPVGRRKALLEIAVHDRALAAEVLADVRASGDRLLEAKAVLALALASGDHGLALEALELARAREQGVVVRRAEEFLAGSAAPAAPSAQPPANGGSTSS
ncbi:ATP-binding protein [Lentzea sp. JNUCC 0626]|uniref:ATP-binding protein n=1 Tax=Lentzea sp. JNUCC 0626 TaxID=3367513 RepID=UPI00374A3E33